MRPPIDPRPGDYKPQSGRLSADDPADVLCRVYALILSWPTADEKRERQPEGEPT